MVFQQLCPFLHRINTFNHLWAMWSNQVNIYLTIDCQSDFWFPEPPTSWNGLWFRVDKMMMILRPLLKRLSSQLFPSLSVWPAGGMRAVWKALVQPPPPYLDGSLRRGGHVGTDCAMFSRWMNLNTKFFKYKNWYHCWQFLYYKHDYQNMGFVFRFKTNSRSLLLWW